jgi:TPR repeat protein
MPDAPAIAVRIHVMDHRAWLLTCHISLAGAVIPLAGAVQAATPDHLIEQALEQLATKRFELSRTYIEPVLIDPRLTGKQRSRAYYLRGYTFYAEALYRSSALDYARALEFDPGNDSALVALAHLHSEGLGVAYDLALAFRLYLRAARIGNDDAKAYVGFALLSGVGTDADLASARYWLTEAAEAGDTSALMNLARSYRQPFAEPADPQTALKLYQDAAERDVPEAYTALGYMQLNGELGAPDPTAAARYFQQAAAHDLPAAATALGHLYLAGKGIAADPAAARRWFAKAVDADYPPAFAGLAYLYQVGIGVTRNPAEAERLYTAGAQRGDATCRLRLAELLLARGDDASTRAALDWFVAAAEAGDDNARNAVAWILATSRHDDLRDGPRAVVEAQALVAGHRSANTLDTLAAAYAEAGRFPEAVATQALALAALTEAERAADTSYAARLNSYQAGRAWRE